MNGDCDIHEMSHGKTSRVIGSRPRSLFFDFKNMEWVDPPRIRIRSWLGRQQEFSRTRDINKAQVINILVSVFEFSHEIRTLKFSQSHDKLAFIC